MDGRRREETGEGISGNDREYRLQVCSEMFPPRKLFIDLSRRVLIEPLSIPTVSLPLDFRRRSPSSHRAPRVTPSGAGKMLQYPNSTYGYVGFLVWRRKKVEKVVSRVKGDARVSIWSKRARECQRDQERKRERKKGKNKERKYSWKTVMAGWDRLMALQEWRWSAEEQLSRDDIIDSSWFYPPIRKLHR